LNSIIIETFQEAQELISQVLNRENILPQIEAMAKQMADVLLNKGN